jgi:hypothetical protein
MVKDPFIKKLWISLGIIVASVVIAVGLVYYFLGGLSKKVTEIMTDRTMVQTQTSAVANLANLERGAAQAMQYQSALNQLLPDQYGLVAFGQWFAKEGQQYNVTANASLQGTPAQPQGATPGTASFTFNADGPLSSLTTFLDATAARSSGFLLTFSSFNLSSDGANYKITGQGTLFFQ